MVLLLAHLLNSFMCTCNRSLGSNAQSAWPRPATASTLLLCVYGYRCILTRHMQCANTNLAPNHAAIYEFEGWVITKKLAIREKREYTFSKLMTYKEERNMQKSLGCQSFFPLCGSLASAALPVSDSCTRKIQVADVVRALLVSGSCTCTA